MVKPKIRFKGYTEDWEQRKLGELLEFRNGFNGGAERYGTGIPLISVMDILSNDFITSGNIRTRANLTETEFQRFKVEYGDVLFIDASQKFEKGKKQNAMTDEHIDAVMELYKNRKTVEKESYLASFEDIEKNDFNLNIPRYVDNFEEEEEIDLDELLTSISTTDDEIEKTQAEFITLLKELTSTDEKIEASLSNLIRKMEG